MKLKTAKLNTAGTSVEVVEPEFNYCLCCNGDNAVCEVRLGRQLKFVTRLCEKCKRSLQRQLAAFGKTAKKEGDHAD